jgi:hypothetical protein
MAAHCRMANGNGPRGDKEMREAAGAAGPSRAAGAARVEEAEKMEVPIASAQP